MSIDSSRSSYYLICNEDLEWKEYLGDGHFGVVQKAIWNTPDGEKLGCAVKHLKKGSMELLTEVVNMQKLRHENIVRLYGVCLKEDMKMLMVLELCEGGSLDTRLKNSIKSPILITMLIEYSKQIADGMHYLEEKHCVHRDLAARNILLTQDEKTIKIADFGLTRKLNVDQDHYILSGTKPIPFAWCPPETLRDKIFSQSSDVWSYGVTLWEIFNYCEKFPWEGYNSRQIIELINSGSRLDKPLCCPKNIYEIMLKCWDNMPEQRPKFSNIFQQLEHVEIEYFDLNFKTKTTRIYSQNIQYEDEIGIIIENFPDGKYMVQMMDDGKIKTINQFGYEIGKLNEKTKSMSKDKFIEKLPPVPPRPQYTLQPNINSIKRDEATPPSVSQKLPPVAPRPQYTLQPNINSIKRDEATPPPVPQKPQYLKNNGNEPINRNKNLKIENVAESKEYSKNRFKKFFLKMKVTFKTITQQAFHFELDESITIGDIKKKIEEVKGDPVDSQKLIYNGKILADTDKLGEVNYDDKKFITVMITKKKPEAKPTETTEAQSSTSATPAPTAAAKDVSKTPAGQEPPTSTPAAPTRAARDDVPEEHQQTVEAIMAMGYERSQVIRVLRASYFNADRAVEYLCTGFIPTTEEFEAAPAEGEGGQAQIDEETGGGLEFLRQLPQFEPLRELIRQNPAMLPQILQQIAAENPKLMEAICNNQEEFVTIINSAPGSEEGGGAVGQGAPVNPNAGNIGGGPIQIQINEADRNAIDRLKGMGFPEQLVIEAYFVCHKNEELAVNYILARMDELANEMAGGQ